MLFGNFIYVLNTPNVELKLKVIDFKSDKWNQLDNWN